MAVIAAITLCAFAEEPWACQDKVAQVESGEIADAQVSWWGYDVNDSTRFIRAALASGAKTVVLDNRGGPYYTLPLSIRSNLKLVVPEGVELVAKRGAYKNTDDALLTLDCVTNVIITGGGTLRMWLDDYTNRYDYTCGEWRHAMVLRGCHNVQIENLKVFKAGGDGICLGTSAHARSNTDIVIRNVTLTRSNRQGISVITADRLLVERCVMEDTCGTLPMSGIDFEPNFPDQMLHDIVMRDCISRRNLGSGFDFSVGNLNGRSKTISITLENCRSEQNHRPLKIHHSDNIVHGFHGALTFRNCVFDDLDQTRAPFSWLGGRDTLSATFENCRAADPADSGKVTSLGLGCGWKATGRPVNINGTPVRRKRLMPSDLGRAKIFDACPGQTVKLPTMNARAGQLYLIYAARPGKVHLAGKAVRINTFAFNGVKFSLKDLKGRSLAELPEITELDKATAIDFEALAAGFYRLELDAGGQAFGFTETDAPIALVIPRENQPPLSWNGGPGEAYLRVPASCERFLVFASGGCGSAFVRAKVYDPDGKLCWDQDDIGCSRWFHSPGQPKPGLWKITAEKATTYDMYNYSFDVFGLHPFLFLTPEKTWEVPDDLDLGLKLNGKEGWAGIPAHPAVLNPPLERDPGTVIRLDGKWHFVSFDGKSSSSFRKPEGDAFYAQEDWKSSRRFMTSAYREIDVPGVWESQGVGKPGLSEPWIMRDNSALQLRNKMMGVGWYRRDVTIPKDWEGKRVWLKLGGIRGEAHVWVNAEPVAIMNEYVADWKFDITKLVEPGETSRVVMAIDNRASTVSGCLLSRHRWGGICRAPELETTPQVFIDDAWVRGDFDGQKAEVKVKVEGQDLNAGLVLRATVEDESIERTLSSSTSTFDLNLPLRHFRPWSPEHPNLYTAKVELVRNGQIVQTWRERFGVRKIEVRGGDFYLNGKPFYMRGYGACATQPITGAPIGDRAVLRQQLEKARAAGFNQVRFHSHCEVSEYFDVCDELGIVIEAELPYYGDFATEYGVYDPESMVLELYRFRRRHPSFLVYGMGNEGTHGKWLDRKLYRTVKELDPDRLAISQSGNFEGNGPEVADYKPIHQRAWEAGDADASRPYTIHEYLNLCVKSDSRDESGYKGAWLPPVTREARAKWLSKAGLGLAWGDRLQTAQFALQGYWQRMGIERARLDSGCDGFSFWTIVDAVVWNAGAETYSAQGLFNPLWQPHHGGLTTETVAQFNSASCVLLASAESNRVFRVGEAVELSFCFSHYGDAALSQGILEWAFVVGDRTLVAGRRELGRQDLGACRAVASERVTVPEVFVACKAVLKVRIVDGGAEICNNAWDFWFFPKSANKAVVLAKAASMGVTVAAEGSEPALSAIRENRPAVIVGKVDGVPNIFLGWWWMGKQMGTAIASHPALAGFPHEGVLSPLLFRIIGDGRPLPAEDLCEKDLIIVSEGGSGCYCHLAERILPDGRRTYFVWGLDVLSDLPESAALLGSLVDGTVLKRQGDGKL
ncbi:MAG: right-handed parallel beta-helix repeat-containing protein [Kiritimatiellae bacterium]|nr:right-handed parallel beta-helix repeat-containing protein [Kiritimatiellia bacterium]